MSGGWEVLAQVVTFLFGLGVTTIGFAMIYKLMPRVTAKWHDVWIGAGVTALLFPLARFLIRLYIGKSGVASGFGATALIWPCQVLTISDAVRPFERSSAATTARPQR